MPRRPRAGSNHVSGQGDDEDWVGTPPEGRYSSDRARPDYWRGRWPAAGAGMLVLLIILAVVLLTR